LEQCKRKKNRNSHSYFTNLAKSNN